MGSKGRVPPHLRRPHPGPGIVHPDPFGPGVHPPPGAFAPYDMLPPPEIMEQNLASQHMEMQRLATENQRLADTHGTLRQELAAAQHELQMLHAHIGSVKSEREQQMRGLMDKISKMEAELQAAESIKTELQQARTEVQKLVESRQENFSKIQQLNQEIQRAHAEAQQLPTLMSERESHRQEYQHYRATYEYETKLYSDHLESLQVMEKNYLTMSREVEKLRAELTNTANVDRRTAGVYGGSTGNNENEASGQLAGQNAYEDGYGAPQARGPLSGSGPGIGTPGSAAAAAAAGGTSVGAPTYGGVQPGPHPARGPGFDASRQPGYDGHRGPGYDAQRGPGYDAQRGPGYDAQRGPGYDAQRGPNFDAQRLAGYDAQRGPSYDAQRAAAGYDAQRGPGYDAQRAAAGYDAQRGPGYDAQKAAAGYDAQRGPGFDAQRVAGYDTHKIPGYDAQRAQAYDASRNMAYEAQVKGGAGIHGQAATANNAHHYGSATPPARSANNYEAAPRRGVNPGRR